MYNPYENNNKPLDEQEGINEENKQIPVEEFKQESQEVYQKTYEEENLKTENLYQNPISERETKTENFYQSSYDKFAQNTENVYQKQEVQETVQPEIQYQPYNSMYSKQIETTNEVKYPQPQVRYDKPKSKISAKMIASIVLLCVLSSALSIFGVSYVFTSGALDGSDDIVLFDDEEDDSTDAEVYEEVDEDDYSSVFTYNTDDSAEALSWSEVAELVTPSVVTIQNYQISESYGFMTGVDSSSDVDMGLVGEGSGIIYSEDGYIVTNAHVVDGTDYLTVMLWDGTYYEAELIGQDDITDLAVIKIDAEGLTAATFGNSDELVVAEGVMAIGSPGGSEFSSTVTIGYISGLQRQISVGDDGYVMTVIQTDAAINPGNSGGALVNQYGEVIGINSSKISDVDYEGLGFAIPISDAESVIYDLMSYGEVVNRAALGIGGQYIDEITAMYNNLSSGVYVASISSELAIEGGLEVYDIITSIDGIAVTSFGTISSMIASKDAGDTVTLTVDRASTGETGIVLEIVLSQTTISE